MSDITRESMAAWTNPYVDIFFLNFGGFMTWRGYDIRKFNPDVILFGETQCKKNGILRF